MGACGPTRMLSCRVICPWLLTAVGAGQKPYSPIALIVGVTHWSHQVCVPFSTHPRQSRFETGGRYSTGDF